MEPSPTWPIESSPVHRKKKKFPRLGTQTDVARIGALLEIEFADRIESYARMVGLVHATNFGLTWPSLGKATNSADRWRPLRHDDTEACFNSFNWTLNVSAASLVTKGKLLSPCNMSVIKCGGSN